MKIVADKFIPYVEDYFGHYGDLILKPGRELHAGDVKDADILIVRSITQVNQSLLADSEVKYVGSVTAGADHLDTAYLDQMGIAWNVAVGFNAPPVADYVVSTIAALQRKNMLAPKAKVAIIGVGFVGRLVAQHLQALNYNIILTDPIRAKNEKEFISTPLEAIEEVDLISVHVPLSFKGEHPTYQFLNKQFFEKQKPGCILINTSRGDVIHFPDLVQFGKHLHWCFDVWNQEPEISKEILNQTVISTPHIAGYAVQSKIRGIAMIHESAVKKKYLPATTIPIVTMPKQVLSFAGEKHHWQDITLGVFNPLVMTAIMRSTLLGTKQCGPLFDDMRNKFTYRHEFGYTTVKEVHLNAEEQEILTRLSIQVV